VLGPGEFEGLLDRIASRDLDPYGAAASVMKRALGGQASSPMPLDHVGIVDHGDHAQPPPTDRTTQRVNPIDFGKQPGPGTGAPFRGDIIMDGLRCFGKKGIGFGVLFGLPASLVGTSPRSCGGTAVVAYQRFVGSRHKT